MAEQAWINLTKAVHQLAAETRIHRIQDEKHARILKQAIKNIPQELDKLALKQRQALHEQTK